MIEEKKSSLMQMSRLALVTFSKKINDWRLADIFVSDAHVEILQGSETDDGGCQFLLKSSIDLMYLPKVTKDNLLVVPNRERIKLEDGIEVFADLMSISRHTRRIVSSPNPSIVFTPKSEEIKNWLEKKAGILTKGHIIPSCILNVDIDVLIQSIPDRVDGVTLLAEANTHQHGIGKMHEYIRIFERGFKLPPKKLVEPLHKFLNPKLNYTTTEIKNWFKKRDEITHADQRSFFAIEKDVRAIIPRMEQAAYDVLINKKEWRSPNVERRNLWDIKTGYINSRGGFVVVRGMELQQSFQLLDQFGKYPLSLKGSIGNLPEDWWPKPDKTLKIKMEKILDVKDPD